MLIPLSFWALGVRGILAPRGLLHSVSTFISIWQSVHHLDPDSQLRSECKLGHWIIYLPFPGLLSDLRPHYPKFLGALPSFLSSVAGPQGAAALAFVRRVTARMLGEPSPNAGCDGASPSPSVVYALLVELFISSHEH